MYLTSDRTLGYVAGCSINKQKQQHNEADECDLTSHPSQRGWEEESQSDITGVFLKCSSLNLISFTAAVRKHLWTGHRVQ